MRIILLLLLFSGVAQAAAPVVSCTVNRSSGVAPLAVFVDCTGTTDADTSYPFRDLSYQHSFGDTAAYWSYGARTLSKNLAFGGYAAHVYLTAGSYTITSLVSDGTTSSRVTNTITVTDPDTVFATTKTECISGSGDFTSCPTGAGHRTTSLYNTAVGFITATNKRLLFHCGETFTVPGAGTTIAITGPGYIGKYGTCSNPIIKATGNSSSGMISFGSGAVSIDDWRIVDVTFDGNVRGGETSSRGVTPSFAPVGVTQITLVRLTMDDMDYGVSFSPTALAYGDQLMIYELTLTNVTGYGLFVGVTNLAFLGSSTNLPASVHNARFPYIGKGVIANNSMAGTLDATGHKLKIHAPDFATTLYSTSIVVRDNKFTPSASNWTVSIGSQNVADERVKDGIVESNAFIADVTSTNAINIGASDIAIRNNLIILNNAATHTAVGITQRQPGKVPDNNAIYNNTVVSTDTAPFIAFSISAGTTNTIIKNNLGWMPNGTGTPTMVSDAGTGTVTATNSSNAQVLTDPLFDNTAVLQGFRTGTTSYAATGGTALYPSSNYDFFNCDDNTANEHIGAFIPRTRANCRGVGQ